MAAAAVLLALGSFALSAPRLRGASEPGGPVLAVVGATLVDGSGARTGFTVVVQDGRIARVGPGSEGIAPAGATIVDGAGRFLIPGLSDMHVHVAIRPESDIATARILALHLAQGVTALRDMGGDPERLAKWRDDVTRGSVLGPDITMAGPFVDGPQEASPSVLPVTDALLASGGAGPTP